MFPNLTSMTCDIFIISVSIVACELSFIVANRILIVKRTRLSEKYLRLWFYWRIDMMQKVGFKTNHGCTQLIKKKLPLHQVLTQMKGCQRWISTLRKKIHLRDTQIYIYTIMKNTNICTTLRIRTLFKDWGINFNFNI
jgi:hAT family C-terminal dimerisation region